MTTSPLPKLVTSLALSIGLALTSCEKTPSGPGAVEPEVPGITEAARQDLPEGTSEGPGQTRRSLDQRIIEALVAAGSDPAKPHRIEHHFALESEAKAKKIAAWGKENGFETTPVEENSADGRRYFTIDLIRVSPLDLETVSSGSQALETLAMKLSVEYDGWGSRIVN